MTTLIIAGILLALILSGMLPAALAGLASLTSTITAQVGWNATLAITGSDYSTIGNATTIKASKSNGTAIANASLGGANELYTAVTSVVTTGSVSIDLTSISDILNQAAGSVARVKGILVRLLSSTDDSVIGTAVAYVKLDTTVANGLASQSGSGWLEAVSIADIANGDGYLWWSAQAGGVVVDSTHKVIKFTGTDGALTAKVQLTIIAGST